MEIDRMKSLVEQIPDIRVRFKKINNGLGESNVIYNDSVFLKWKARVLIELDKMEQTQTIVDIRNTIKKIDGWDDERLFKEMTASLEALVETETDPAETLHLKLKRGVHVISAFNDYFLVKQVGQGGNGKVWEALDKNENKCALKFLLRSNHENTIKRFKNEAFFCIRHEHKNIMPIMDYGVLGEDYIFYVMPFYKDTLRTKMNQGMQSKDIVEVFIGILEGLNFAHKAGAIHRDIKPENILFAEGSNMPIIADFGIAHFADKNLETYISTGKCDRMANFQYAAPEQRKKGEESFPQTDVYAAALLLNEMFTGDVPQASDYRKIRDVDEEYAYLDDIFEMLFRQNPLDRLYPVDDIITQMSALTKHYKKEHDIICLQERAIEMSVPQTYSPKIKEINYENNELIIEFNTKVDDEWYNVLLSGNYEHSFVWGYAPERLLYKNEYSLTMPLNGSHNKNTIKDIVMNIKDWVIVATEKYNNMIVEKIRKEQKQKEQRRLDKIRRLKDEQEMNDFIATL